MYILWYKTKASWKRHVHIVIFYKGLSCSFMFACGSRATGAVAAMRVTTVHAEGDFHRQFQPQWRQRRGYRELRRYHLCSQGHLQEVSESRQRESQPQRSDTNIVDSSAATADEFMAGRLTRRSPAKELMFFRAATVWDSFVVIPRDTLMNKHQVHVLRCIVQGDLFWFRPLLHSRPAGNI